MRGILGKVGREDHEETPCSRGRSTRLGHSLVSKDLLETQINRMG